MIARLLARIRLAQKFLILGALILATMGWTIWLLVGALQEQIDFSAKEVRGTVYHRAVQPLLEAVQAHGEAKAAGLRGRSELASAAAEAAARADRAVQTIDEADRAHGEALAVHADWTQIREEWNRVKSATDKAAEETLERHGALAHRILELLDAIGDNSNLVLDPDLDTFYLMSAAVGQLPHMSQATSRVRLTAVALATSGAMAPADERSMIGGKTELGLRVAQVRKALGESMKATPAVKSAVETPLASMQKALEDMTRTIDESFIGLDKPRVTPGAIFAIGGRAMTAQSQLYEASIETLETLLRARVDRLVTKRNSILTVVGVIMLVVSILGFIVIRDMVRRLGRAAGWAGDISGGRFDGDITVIGTDEIEQLNASFKRMQENLRERIERDTKMLAENHRIRQALDSSTTNLRVCDNEGTVLFANRALVETTRTLEPEIRKRVPEFTSDGLVGSSIGVFYDRPNEALEALRNLTGTRRSMLDIGGRKFEIVTHPVLGESGEKLGSVGEWIDRTDQLAAEKQMAEIIEAASRGDLQRRLETTSLSGFYQAVGNDINKLLDTLGNNLGEVARVLRGLGEGDLSTRMTGRHEGVFAELQRDCDRTMERVSGLLRQIRDGSASIRLAANEISQGNTDLSARTEQQASSLEETASSMEELTSTVKQNADNAKQANQLAMGASASAQRGGETVKEVVTTMKEIAESSKRIQDIIGVIDGIAFQTNILALNAAVEAARAGEQGRGFAVVASEVRSLAQRSAGAAKEIKTLIGESATKVEAGAALVDEAGTQMNEIVTAVRRVTDIMGEIAAASAEQSSGIEQVGQAVTSMDEVTQQNAALVEEAAAAAESLLEQSEHLMHAVSVFKLEPSPAEGEAAAVITKAARSAERAIPATPAQAARRPQAPARRPTSVKAVANGAPVEGDVWAEF